MSTYRLYVLNVLNDAERVENSLEEDFPDDAAALARASEALGGEKAVEVWVGARLVARLGPEFRV